MREKDQNQLVFRDPGFSPGRSLRLLSEDARERAFACLSSFVLRRPGGNSGEPVPDPIPNSAVKLPCADGTKSQGLEE